MYPPTSFCRFFRASALPLLALSIGSLIGAHAQDLPPPARADLILKELDQISSETKNKIQSRRSTAISQIQSACSSGPAAMEFYASALSNTKYKESPQDYMDWRKKNQDLFLNLSYQNAALLQLRYMLLALQRSETVDAYAQVPETLAYLNALAAGNFLGNATSDRKGQKFSLPSDAPIPEAREILNQSLGNSPVATWLQISDLVSNNKNFEGSGGNYTSIMENNVRVPLRDKKDARLLTTWDTQLEVETAAANATHSQQQMEAFNQTRIPELLYKKAQDTVAIGQPNRGLGEILILIHGYPTNPAVKDWVENARSLVPSIPAPVAPTSSTNAAVPPTPGK